MIPAYLEESLDAREMQEFLDHIDNCPECKEELTIQFLISDGLKTLETGDNYDLQSAMDDKVSSSHREIELHNRLFTIRNVGVGLVLLMCAIAVFGVYYVFFM